MAVFAGGALVYADNWAKKISGFVIAGGCALYEFHRIREMHRFHQERRRRISAESDED